jgi:uncharacterized membrane protein
MEAAAVLLSLLVLAVTIAFPIYVLVRLAELGRAVRDLKQEMARRGAPGEPAKEPPAAQAPFAPAAPPLGARDITEIARRAEGVTPPPAAAETAEAVPEAAAVWPPAPPRPPAPPTTAPEPRFEMRDLESLLGANWLSKLGIAAIVIAAALFLKYAFQSGWIVPTARVTIGVVSSGILLGLGQWLLSKPVYRAYAQVLSSGGIIILFLSIYAGYNFYSLIGFAPAFAVLALAAVSASALAMSNNTQAVALLCLAGAFATPMLIRQEGAGPSNLLGLYAYLSGLNLWSAILVRYRPWHSLTVVSFGATWLLFFGGGPLHGPRYLAAEAFALLFLAFACYGGLRTARIEAGRAAEFEGTGVALVLGGCLAFLAASAQILSYINAAGLPALSAVGALTALLLAGLAFAFRADSDQQKAARSLFRFLAAGVLGLLVAATISEAPPIARGQVAAAFSFALLTYIVFLAVAAHMARKPGGEGPAVALIAANAVTHAVVAFHALAPLRVWGINAAPIWLPIAGWLTLGALLAVPRLEGVGRHFRAAVALTAQALPLCALFGALALAHGWPAGRAVAVFGAEFLLVSATWVAAGGLVSRPGFRGDLLAAFGNAVVFFGLLAAAARLQAHEGLVLLCGCAIAMAAYHALVGGSVLRGPGDDRLHRFLYLGLALTFLTIAIPLQLRAHYVTLAWAVEGAVLMWTGLAVGDRRVRWASVILISLTGAKSLFLDIGTTPEPFRLLLNARMLSGASVIAACYLAAWLLSRAQDTLSAGERTVAAALTAVGSIFTLIFVSLDLWDFMGRAWAAASRESAQQLALSLFWSAYGLAAVSVGFWQRTRAVRLFAMGLLCVAITKVFLFDLGFLDTPYRIVSFFVLGVILLTVALLYTRFEGRLK